MRRPWRRGPRAGPLIGGSSVRLAVSPAAWDRAADFWAIVRNAGIPTSGPDDLDADAILGGMAATVGGPGDVVTIPTTNVRHLSRFPSIDVREWATIS